MYFWKSDSLYTTIECEKCGKVLKYENKYFIHEANYCVPKVAIKCMCGNITSSTIYTKNSDTTASAINCPKCNSSQIQLVNRRWSFLGGFFTNKIDRVCMRCKYRF